MECSSALNGFGIPTDRLPLKYDGSIKLDDHLQWIAVREAKEEAHRQGKAFDVIECPLNMDILAGEWKIWGEQPNRPMVVLYGATTHPMGSRFQYTFLCCANREGPTDSKPPGQCFLPSRLHSRPHGVLQQSLQSRGQK